MLQIRLSKGPPGGPAPPEGGGSGSTGKSLPPSPESGVTVACPDHLVLADLPVAKSLGNPSSSAQVKTVGRRSRRQLGERVHFCVRCDFPIAIYGRLSPCEHAFCLVCARSDSSCYLCDERIQKIQTIKMLEGIFICAAPHCLKSFLKRSLFEAHINETHADLLQLNADKEEPANEYDGFMATSRPSSASSDLHPKPPILPEPSASRAQSRPIAPTSHSPGIFSSDRDDKARRNQPKEQLAPPPAVKQPPQPRPPLYSRPPDQQIDSTQQNFDRLPPPPPFNRFQQQQNNFDLPMGPPRKDSELFPEKQHESSSVQDYLPPQGQFPPAFPPSYAYPPPMPVAPDGSQPFYYDASRPDLPSEGVSEQQGSLLGFPSIQSQGTYIFHESNYSRPWNMAVASGQSTSYEGLPGMPGAQGSYMPNQSSDFAAPRVPFFQGDGSRVMGAFTAGRGSELGGSAGSIGVADYQEGKGVLAPLPPPPPLPLPPPHLKRGKFGGPPPDAGLDGYGWQRHDKRSYNGSQD